MLAFDEPEIDEGLLVNADVIYHYTSAGVLPTFFFGVGGSLLHEFESPK